MTTQHAQLFLEILADASRQPAALRMHLKLDDGEALNALLAGETFARLTGRIPVLLLKSEFNALPAPLTTTLETSGCTVIDPTSIQPLGANSAELAAYMAPPTARYVSGDWYLAAPTKPSSAQTASRTLALKLLQLVAAEADTRELEAIFRHDPSMSYQLLRLVNSIGMGSRRISSFAQAIVMLGRNQLRRWINLMLFAPRKEDPRLAMLMARVSVRARTMELLARAAGYDKVAQESAFMAGMFSLLGVLFGMPLVDVLKPLNIGDELSAAVLREEGRIGQVLSVVTAAEQGDPLRLSALLETLDTPAFNFDAIQIEAHLWMLELMGEASGETNG